MESVDSPPSLEGLLTRVREPFAIPSETSRFAGLWIALFRTLTLPVLLVGREHRFEATTDGEVIRIVTVGFRRRFDEFLEQMLGPVVHKGDGPLRLSWREPALSRLPADLVIVDVHRFLLGSFRRAGWLVVPEDVRWTADPSGVPPDPASESLRADMRKIARQPFALEEGGTSDDWNEFVDDMVIPHLRARFQDGAQLPSRRARGALQKRARLFFLTRDGERVAGGCLIPTRQGVVLRRLGIRDGDVALMQDGALTALYLLMCAWAAEHGHGDFDSGTTMPLPRSGLARFKAKLGMTPARNPIALTAAVRCSTENAGLASLLERSPLFHETQGRIERYP